MTDESPTSEVDSTDQQAAATRETEPTPPVAAPTPAPDAPETPREPVAGPSPADPNAPPVPKRTRTPTFVPGFKQITTDDYSKTVTTDFGFGPLSQTFPFLGLGIEIANEDPDMGQLEDKGTTWYGTIIRFGADRVEIAESLERLAQSLRSGNDARSSEQQRAGYEVNRGRYFGPVAPDAGLVL